MADSDISFHGGTPNPSTGFQEGSNSYGYFPEALSKGEDLRGAEEGPNDTPGNPIPFGQSPQAG